MSGIFTKAAQSSIFTKAAQAAIARVVRMPPPSFGVAHLRRTYLADRVASAVMVDITFDSPSVMEVRVDGVAVPGVDSVDVGTSFDSDGGLELVDVVFHVRARDVVVRGEPPTETDEEYES